MRPLAVSWASSPVPHIPNNIHELTELHNREGVFRDRDHAGQQLARLLEHYRDSDALVLGIPAGGVPVAVAVADELGLAFDVAIVSKITLPWNTEVGFGAIAFDGTVRLNERMLRDLGLTAAQVGHQRAQTHAKVERRMRQLRGDRPFPALAGRPVIVVDDGLASGFTMRVALEALRHQGATELVVAVPTGHADTVAKLAADADLVCCANIRADDHFAVARAYQTWRDVAEQEVLALLVARL